MHLYERPEVHARRWFLLGVLSLSLVLVVMSVSGLNVALAALQRDVGVTAAGLQWIVNAYPLAFGGLLLTGGALGDRYGRKGALLGGLLVFGLGALMGGLASTAAVILVARAVMGLGAALVMPATLSLVVEVFGPDERPKAIALWAGFAGGGAAIGPLLTGLFVSGWWFVPAWGWQAGFFYNLPVVALVMLAMAVWLPRSRDPSTPPLDLGGAALSIVALTALIYAIIEGPERGWSSPAVLAGFVVAVVFGAALVWWQNRATHPMLPLNLFLDHRFTVGAGVLGMAFVVLIGFWFLLALWVQFVLGYSALEAGAATMPEALASVAAAPVAERLAARFGSRRVMSSGFLVLTVAFVMLAFVNTNTSYWYLLGPLVLEGVGLSLAMIPATNDIMAATPMHKAGVGSAVNDASRELGAALGIAIFGSLSASLYRAGLDDTVLPESVLGPARESMGGALEATESLRAQGVLSVEEASMVVAETGQAFTTSFAWTMAATGAVSLLVAVALVASRRGRSVPAAPVAAI